MPMPPTGSLPPEQIELIKNWIDQGALWPGAASGETPPPPPDRKAVGLMEALRAGDRQSFHSLVKEPAVVKAKGLGGSTPLMFAVTAGRKILLLIVSASEFVSGSKNGDRSLRTIGKVGAVSGQASD